MVLNIGRRPTVEADSAAAITVEAHIMHTFAAGFYGRHCRALVCGFIRCAIKVQPARVIESSSQHSVTLGSSDVTDKEPSRVPEQPLVWAQMFTHKPCWGPALTHAWMHEEVLLEN